MGSDRDLCFWRDIGFCFPCNLRPEIRHPQPPCQGQKFTHEQRAVEAVVYKMYNGKPLDYRLTLKFVFPPVTSWLLGEFLRNLYGDRLYYKHTHTHTHIYIYIYIYIYILCGPLFYAHNSANISASNAGGSRPTLNFPLTINFPCISRRFVWVWDVVATKE